jgi:DNA topoisomerase IA
LPEEQIDDVPIIIGFPQHVPELAAIQIRPAPIIRKSVFDSLKVSAHHAIIPTMTTSDLAVMSADEKSAFMPDYDFERDLE